MLTGLNKQVCDYNYFVIHQQLIIFNYALFAEEKLVYENIFPTTVIKWG